MGGGGWSKVDGVLEREREYKGSVFQADEGWGGGGGGVCTDGGRE